MNNVALKHKAGVNPIIGVWTTADRKSMRVENGDGTQTFSGPNVQVSRLGNPLVNEVVIPRGSKDLFNSSQPKDDAQFLGYVHDDPELPEVVHAVYPSIPVPDSSPDPGVQRDDLVSVFLTGLDGLNQPPDVTPSEELRLNMKIPPCEPGSCGSYSDLGVIGGDNAGFPNGRRLSDDIIDVSLRVVLGALLPNHQALADTIGDGVDANDVPFNEAFPYVAYPHSGSDTNSFHAVATEAELRQFARERIAKHYAITAQQQPACRFNLLLAKLRLTLMISNRIALWKAQQTPASAHDPPRRLGARPCLERQLATRINQHTQRVEPICGPAHSRQSDRRDNSAQCPNHGRLSAVPLG
jgi:hypothetical protein